MGLARAPRLLFVLLLAVSGAAILRAAVPTFWTVATQAEFLKGEAENLSIDGDGRLMLGPALEQVAETPAPFLWAIVTTPAGSFVGSGNEGTIYRIGDDGRATVFADTGELEVHALAAAPDGGLFAGTSPDGKVYRIGRDGSVRVIFDPEDRYIWSLAVDRAGALYVGTGDKGVVYRVAPDGAAAPFYRTRATHVLALAFDRDGRVLAGTESPGRVFRIDAEGKGFVLLDSPHREIRSLRVAPNGVIYAAALSQKPGVEEERPPDRPPEPSRPAPVPTVSTEITAIAIVDTGQPPATTTAGAREPRRPARGAVYRILPDGLFDLVWQSDEDLPYDLAVEDDRQLLLVTGPEGRIYRLAGEPVRPTLVGRAPAQQITQVVRTADGHHVLATANPGKLFRLSSARARRGTYLSDVRDASTVASWGTISWRAQPNGGRLEIATRSGNTATPDETWSDWSAPYRVASGDRITSPKARYLQWRAVLAAGPDGASPVLTSVTVAYLPRNLRPEVTSITVYPPGVVFQRPFSTGEPEIAGYEDQSPDGRAAAPGRDGQTGPQAQAPLLGRRMYQKGLQTFVWKADDPNDDRLQYDVFYRRDGEAEWRPIRRGLWDPILVWDTTSVPDGTYVIKVVATDAASNSPGTALVGERESGSFEVDNTPPRISLEPPADGGGRRTIVFTVRDDQSAVQRVEYSLEGERWRVLYPVDGIPDSRVEAFRLELEAPAGRTVIIRATDAMQNVASAVAR
jgi:sugar lactone lactonase YvrE